MKATVLLPPTVVDEIRRHGEEAYPEESCGYLIGQVGEPSGDSPRRVHRSRRATNAVESNRLRRYVIVPDELRKVEEEAARSGESVAGFYHSHPDHPALPSEFDRIHAWPWYVYVILAVTDGKAGEVSAFELDPATERFDARPIEATADSSAPARTGEADSTPLSPEGHRR